MSFSIGIIGLPNVGKSTLFKALTQQEVGISPRPFTTINPNVGMVAIPDERLQKVAEIAKSQKIVPTSVEFVDIAGLVKDAHKGAGLGNQFLSHIRQCKAVIEVVRVFEDVKVEHVEGRVDPREDIDTINIELLMKDMETCEGALTKAEKKEEKKARALRLVREALEKEIPVRTLNLNKEEAEQIREFQFLTEKPVIFLFNTDSNEISTNNLEKEFSPSLSLNLKIEEEISELDEKEKEELEMRTSLDKLIVSCYNALNLISFFTIAGGKEARAWTIEKGANCAKAGGIVHSDFEEKLIKAEVVAWDKLVRAGSWKNARELGWLKVAGRDYEVQDGDVIEFKI